MSDIMRPIPFGELLTRIFGEYQTARSIFGIHESQFFRRRNRNRLRIFGESCDSPVGPAAGPHTQLAQNIVAAYLVGGRFFELKTVQKMDTLEIEKPCIDTGDECYNTEWSTEYTIPKAFGEYVKAWIALHLIERAFGFHDDDTVPRSFIFNMSVGYDLEGIRLPKMDAYLNDLMDASCNGFFQECLDRLDRFLSDGSKSSDPGFIEKFDRLRGLPSNISPVICRSVTLSTMHGCPPDEIEAICTYLLSTKKLHTFVKLNPTLLGYATVRSLLDGLGFQRIELGEKTFSADLQYADAVAMIGRLLTTAKKTNVEFGVKLTNTLAAINNKKVLPGEEMYMSGRALFPLSINLAAKLSADFQGGLPISYSGGATKWNIGQIFRCGIRPITIATDMLKPGGYYRLGDCAHALESAEGWESTGRIDVGKLSHLAADSRTSDYCKQEWRGDCQAQVASPLPLYDCCVAPCVEACAIGQDIPEYIRLVGQGEYDRALATITSKNALPSITGHICDHQCMFCCTRLDYEGPVKIRDMKRIAAEKGNRRQTSAFFRGKGKREVKVAIVGAGPAGLSAAYFLAQKGFDVTVLEKRKSAGGVVSNIIPKFRIPADAVQKDIRHIEELGVKFVYGVSPNFKIDALKKEGYKYVCVAIGAEKGYPIDLKGDNRSIFNALDFLAQYRENPEGIRLGGSVAVVGGGNTAMDGARAAKRVKGVEKVTVLYRRSLEQMPADREEYDMALEDRVDFRFLANPERFDSDGTLSCRTMKLGDADESGRRRPVETEELFALKADSVISAIGEKVDQKLLAESGIPLNTQGWAKTDTETLETTENVFLIGDAQSGPATIVRCIADARIAADTIAKREGIEKPTDPAPTVTKEQLERIHQRRGTQTPALGLETDGESFAKNEAYRCLECDLVCNKCVDVCPNRANVAIPLAPSPEFRDAFQIVHLDAFCNECGNCGYFCPHRGLPYKDKLTLFNRADDFHNSTNSGFWVDGNTVHLRLAEKETQATVKIDGTVAFDGPHDESFGKALRVTEAVLKEHGYLLGPVEQ